MNGQPDGRLSGKRFNRLVAAMVKRFDEKVEMDGCFDVKRIDCSTDEISFGLTFVLKGLDRETLAMFAGRSGKLTIKDSEPIPDDAKEEDDSEESEEE